MIDDGRRIPAESTILADVCIVGAGPAGMPIALSLSRNPKLNVCLIESGGLKFDDEVQALASGQVVGTPYFPLDSTRIRAFGGTSMAWAGVCVSLSELAFQHRPWVADAEWPIAYADIEPYLGEALSLSGITASEKDEAEASIEARAREFGLDTSLVVPTPVYFGPPTRFGSAYEKQVRDGRNLRALLYSNVTDVLLDESGRRVASLRVRRLDGTEFTVSARHYVLAAGGIENARLLLSSNDVHQQGVGNGNGLVGKFFMEHPRVYDYFRVLPGATPLGRLLGRHRGGRLRFIRLSLPGELQRRERLVGYHANLRFGYSYRLTPEWESVRRLASLVTSPWKESPYYYPEGLRKRLDLTDVGRVLRRPHRALISAAAEAAKPESMRRYLSIESAVEQVPSDQNYVELLNETDVLGMRKVRVHWGTSEIEERTYRRGLAVVLEQLSKHEDLEPVSSVDSDSWPARIMGTWHHMGTTRMHASPGKGVVDAQCRVHGIDNLFIAGSSVFPGSGTAPPTVTIVQLSLRLADHVAQLQDIAS